MELMDLVVATPGPEPLEQQLRDALTLPGDVLTDGGESNVGGDVVVVDAYDGEILGHPEATIPGDLHRPDRHLVRTREHRGRR